MRAYDVEDYSRRTIGQVLASQAAAIGDDIWMRSAERQVTFGEAHVLANRYANGLAAQGVRKGEIVAMLVQPSIDVVLIALAVARLGAVFTNISTEYKGAFLDDALKQCGARILIVDHDLCPGLLDLASLGPTETVFVRGDRDTARGDVAFLPFDNLLSSLDHAPDVEVHWYNPVQIWWSSGTTGKSKGILHSHSSILQLAGEYAKDHVAGDVLYSCTPIYLGSSWNGAIWRSLVAGIRVAIDQKFSVSNFWNQIRHYDVTHMLTFGAMHMLLMQQPERPDDADNPVRCAECNPMPYTVIPEFKRRFGVERMDQCYGQSETFIVTRARDDGTQWGRNAIGYPQPYFEVRVLDDTDMEAPVGVPGEICVRPVQPGILFNGYFNQPEATATAWRSLWHHTGDMAYRDENGIFYFVDRKKDYIRYLGRNISMFEVESIAGTHPDVAEVAAVGIASKELESESELMLCAVLKEGANLTPEALALFINTSAPYYFVPRYIQFLPELPRNAHRRLVKFKLQEKGVDETTWDRVSSGFIVQR